MKDRIGRYRVLRPLGEGGMGRVLLAESTAAGGFHRLVVLKQVRDAADPDLRRALLEEARVQATLVHRNVVPVLDLLDHEEEHFMVLEHVDGLDLRRLIEQTGPLPWPVVVHVGMEIASGLDYVHRRANQEGKFLGLVHRDVSPANILCSWEGEVKLTDFGIAATSASRGFGVVGNFAYIAPEQAAEETIDGRADLFSLGVVMYEAITGKNPFRAKTDEATLAAVRAGKVPPISDLLAPVELRQIIQSLVAVNPAMRFDTAAKLREALVAVPRRLPDPGPAFARFLAQARNRSDQPRPALSRLVEAGRAFTRRVGLSHAPEIRDDTVIERVPMGARRRVTVLVAIAALLSIGSALALHHRFSSQTLKSTAPAPQPNPSPSPEPSPSPSPEPSPSPSPSPEPSPPPSPEPPPTPSPSPSPRPTPAPKRARPGWLSVNSIPWSNLWLDDKPIGHTPRMHLPVPAGKHRVRLRSANGDERLRVVEIRPGQDTKLTVTFAAP